MDHGFDLIEQLTQRKNETVIVWLCNIGAEKYWNNVSSGIVDKREDEIAAKMEEINLLLCRPQDILILREKPDAEYLETMAGYGFPSPRVLYPGSNDPCLSISELVLRDDDLLSVLAETVSSKGQAYFVPYAVTELEEKIARRCNLTLIGPSSDVCKWINNKIHNREIAQHLDFPVCEGKICRSMDEIRETYDLLTKKLFNRVIIKEPYGASGKGLYIIARREMLEPTLAVISRFSRMTHNSAWLVEGWYENKTDINYQIYISPNGKTRLISVKEQILNGVVYVGSKMGSAVFEANIIQRYSEIAERLGNHLYTQGYTGIASIDSIITETGVIIPIIEINGRLSLSTYISFTDRLFRGRIISSMYYRVKAEKTMSYADIRRRLAEEGLSFDVHNNEGIIVYSSATLPRGSEGSPEVFPGRMFALMVSRTTEGIGQLKAGFIKMMASIFISFA